jgi:hypothetical protein
MLLESGQIVKKKITLYKSDNDFMNGYIKTLKKPVAEFISDLIQSEGYRIDIEDVYPERVEKVVIRTEEVDLRSFYKLEYTMDHALNVFTPMERVIAKLIKGLQHMTYDSLTYLISNFENELKNLDNFVGTFLDADIKEDLIKIARRVRARVVEYQKFKVLIMKKYGVKEIVLAEKIPDGTLETNLIDFSAYRILLNPRP